MRIGLITPGFSASEQDWCIPALRDLVVALSRRLELRVFALRYPHLDTRYRVFGVPVRSFGAAGTRGWRRGGLLARAVASVRTSLRTGQLDAVHALWAHEPGLVATLACAGTGRRAVVSILGGELVALPDIDYGGQLSRFNRCAIGWSLRHAAAVTVGSEALRQVGARGGWPADRWHQVPLGVDIGRFRPCPGAGGDPAIDGDPCLLQVGSLTPVKGHELLLDAYPTVLRRLPGARLHIVGAGPMRQRLEERVEDLGLGAAVQFHGAVEHDRMPSLYQQADVAVVSSWFESQSVAVIEAAACGCAVFGTPVGVLPQLDGASVCAGRDAATFARKLLSLVADRDRLRRRGERCRRWVLGHADVEGTADMLLQLYRQMGQR